MDFVIGILISSLDLMNEMSLYILIGLLFAGILHVVIPSETISKHLGKNNFSAIIKASLFGIPLPLCSCGVIPAAIHLKKEGASNGSTVAFLVSTPTTGIDSILATYSLLGFFFAIYRIIASFLTAIIAGLLTNMFTSTKLEELKQKSSCRTCHTTDCHDQHNYKDKIKAIYHYAIFELLADISKWLIIGILLGGIISYSIPETFFQTHFSSNWQTMFIMLLISIPFYVCATGSIPIAASLMLKGLNPGAAFVFLFAGPATNTVTISVLAKELGKKTVIIYILTISLAAILFGLGLNIIWNNFLDSSLLVSFHEKMLSPQIKYISSIILTLCILLSFLKKN